MRAPFMADKRSFSDTGPSAVDGVFLRLVPWLALRHDFADGSFLGKGDEQLESPAFLTAQARAILEVLDLKEKLPHIVRTKLDAWRPYTLAELAKPSVGTPLALATQASLGGDAADLAKALAPFFSSDGGYTLKPQVNRPGLMAAAHHLLVEARPSWFALRDLPVPSVGDEAARHFLSQLLPSFST